MEKFSTKEIAAIAKNSKERLGPWYPNKQPKARQQNEAIIDNDPTFILFTEAH